VNCDLPPISCIFQSTGTACGVAVRTSTREPPKCVMHLSLSSQASCRHVLSDTIRCPSYRLYVTALEYWHRLGRVRPVETRSVTGRLFPMRSRLPPRRVLPREVHPRDAGRYGQALRSANSPRASHECDDDEADCTGRQLFHNFVQEPIGQFFLATTCASPPRHRHGLQGLHTLIEAGKARPGHAINAVESLIDFRCYIRGTGGDSDR
jgi:hypothetical protein